MAQDLLDVILSTAYTKIEALNRVRALREYVLGQLFGNGKAVSKEHLPTGQSVWLASLDKDFCKSFNRANVYDLLDALEEEVKKIEAIVIYLPFNLPEETVSELGQRLRLLFGPRSLAEIRTDPTLLAGAALVWKGIYKDYSLRKKIKENHQSIAGILRKELQGHG